MLKFKIAPSWFCMFYIVLLYCETIKMSTPPGWGIHDLNRHQKVNKHNKLNPSHSQIDVSVLHCLDIESDRRHRGHNFS